MAVIKLLTGTTEDYKAVESVLILDEREIAVEITNGESGEKYFNIRQGDGKSTFFDLPIIVNNQRFEEINKVIAGYRDEIMGFSNNMSSATFAAQNAAQEASNAAQKAESAVANIENLTQGMNSMTDDETGVVYVFGIENGVVYLSGNDE